MEQRARAEARKDNWLQRVEERCYTSSPSVFVGPIAAGSSVVASTKSATYKFIQEHYSDALVVEEEGFGFLEAVHANPGVEALVVRGVSDCIDDKAQVDEKGFQKIAAENAAAFAFEVLANLVIPDKTLRTAHTSQAQEKKQPTSIEPEALSSPVKLELKLFLQDRNQGHEEELVFTQDARSIPWTRVFGLALNNLSKSVTSENIGIRLEFYWQGDYPNANTTPSFHTPPHSDDWDTQISQVKNEQAAVLVFRNANLTCFPGQPIEWRGFSMELKEQMRGYFLILYKISSARPYSDNSGELKIHIDS